MNIDGIVFMFCDVRNSFKLPSLTVDERRALAQTYLEIHSKKLSPSQVDSVSNANPSPLFLRSMIDELRSIATFETLDRLILTFVLQQSNYIILVGT
jgi:hypothetical protein